MMSGTSADFRPYPNHLAPFPSIEQAQNKRAWQRWPSVIQSHWPFLLVIPYFFGWIKRGLVTYFNWDDMMNCYRAFIWTPGQMLNEILHFWSSQNRPFAELAYRGMYEVFGFHPHAFRDVCFVVMVVNLWLAWKVLLLLTRSRLVAFTGLLFGCYRGTMWDIYSSTGSIYDVLCATLTYAIIVVFLRKRACDLPLSCKDICVLPVFTVLAICSKEMALGIPCVLAAYELLFRVPQRLQLRAWTARRVLEIGPVAVVVLAYVVGRLTIPGPVSEHPAYAPVFTAARLTANVAAYSSLLFMKTVPFTVATGFAFWGALGALGLFLRSRLMLFGWCSFLVLMMPMMFILTRVTGYFFYVPMIGLMIFVSGSLDVVMSYIQRQTRMPFSVPARVVAAAMLIAIVSVHAAESKKRRMNNDGPGGQWETRTLAEQVPRLWKNPPPNSRVLVVNGPFPGELYIPQFILSLRYHRKDLDVQVGSWQTGTDVMCVPPGKYERVFLFDRDHRQYEDATQLLSNGGIAQLLPSDLPMRSSKAMYSLIHDFGELEGGMWRWALQDPEVRLKSAQASSHLNVVATLPELEFVQTGPVHLAAYVDGIEVGRRALEHVGTYQLSFALTSPVAAGQVAHVHIHVDNPYPRGNVKLGFVMNRISLTP